VNPRDGIPVQCESIPHPFCASAGESAGEWRPRADEIAAGGQFRVSSAGERHCLAARPRPPQRHRDRTRGTV